MVSKADFCAAVDGTEIGAVEEAVDATTDVVAASEFVVEVVDAPVDDVIDFTVD